MFRVNILTTKLYSLEVTPQLWIFWNIPFSMFQTSHVPLQPFCADLTPMTPTCYDFNSLSKWQPIQTENNKPSLHSRIISPACTVAPQVYSPSLQHHYPQVVEMLVFAKLWNSSLSLDSALLHICYHTYDLLLWKKSMLTTYCSLYCD